MIDAKAGAVLFFKNPDIQRPVASTQKLLTALLVAEHGGLENSVRVASEDCAVEPTKLGFRPGEIYTKRQLLAAMLVHSCNDAAVCLARNDAGSIASFAGLMNAKAAQLGAGNSHFVNPNGLPRTGQFSTARDMARIAFAAYHNSTLREFMRLPGLMFTYSSGRQRFLEPTNRLVTRSSILRDEDRVYGDERPMPGLQRVGGRKRYYPGSAWRHPPHVVRRRPKAFALGTGTRQALRSITCIQIGTHRRGSMRQSSCKVSVGGSCRFSNERSRSTYFGIVHSGSVRGLKASDTVFQDQTVGWMNTHPAGGFEKHIRERLTAFDLFGGDDDREKVFESDDFQGPGDDGEDASGGYCDLGKGSDLTREFRDFPNRLNRWQFARRKVAPSRWRQSPGRARCRIARSKIRPFYCLAIRPKRRRVLPALCRRISRRYPPRRGSELAWNWPGCHRSQRCILRTVFRVE